MKTILISFCDSLNLGDLLIVECMENLIQPYGRYKTIDFNLCDKIDEHKNEIFIRKQKNSLFLLYQKYLRNFFVFDKLHELKNRRDISKLNWENYRKLIDNSDLVIIGGGNAIFGLTKYTSSVDRVFKIVEYAKKQNKKIFLCSVGIGPFKSEKQIKKLNMLLQMCDYVTTRDQSSFEYLELLDKNKYVSTDPVLFLPSEINKLNYLKQNNLGICVMDIRSNKMTEQQYVKYKNNLKKLIINLKKENDNIEIYLYSTDLNDYITVYELSKELKEKNVKVIIKEINNIETLIDFYADLDLVIGTRMHSLIVAFSQLIPTIGFSWQPKVDGFFETIGDSTSVYEIDKIGDEMDDVLDNVQKKLHDLNTEIIKISNKKAMLKQKFDINNRILEEVRSEYL
ncbi:polysaccharide pyruvyl transferase family protein [Vagococcus carniphilus]|uniref:polysaccharide pyruvyl transferase family protein n=1 Tax=Vagococcus carniphilus TaxID=218144 RepID=UPI003B59DB5F